MEGFPACVEVGTGAIKNTQITTVTQRENSIILLRSRIIKSLLNDLCRSDKQCCRLILISNNSSCR
jgi:hypothetical protein